MTKKKIHLHIGLPKTATTLIQNTLFAAPDLMSKHGIRYLQTGTDVFGDRGHHLLVSGTLGSRGRRILRRLTDEDLAAAWPAARKEIDAAPETDIFISSELFSFAVSEPEDIQAVKEQLKEYDVQVVLVLRDVGDFVDSVYAQRLKGGFEGTIGEFVGRNWDNLHWRDMTQRWAQVFGRANIKVLDFGKLRDGNLVSNFIQTVFGADIDASVIEADTANVALPYYAAKIIHEVNGSDMSIEAKTNFRIHLRDFFDEHGAKGTFRKAKFLSDDSRKILHRYCQWPKVDH